MKHLKNSLVTLTILFSLVLFSQADQKNHHKEISQEERVKVALSLLKKSPNTVQVYARGLICETCGIGVRKKLQRLDFVDSKKSQKGILLNVKSQLVSIAIKDGSSVNAGEITEAIKKAGYDPVTLHELSRGGSLKTTSLEN